jgi:addiction module HigA family antidote
MIISRDELDGGLVDLSEVTTGELLSVIAPGEILKEEFMVPLGVSANRLGRDIGVPPNRILAILAGRRSITADTALRLGAYFGTSAQFWINLQANCDLRRAERASGANIRAEVRPLQRRAAA